MNGIKSEKEKEKKETLFASWQDEYCAWCSMVLMKVQKQLVLEMTVIIIKTNSWYF